MPLTDTAVKKAKPGAGSVKLSDGKVDRHGRADILNLLGIDSS